MTSVFQFSDVKLRLFLDIPTLNVIKKPEAAPTTLFLCTLSFLGLTNTFVDEWEDEGRLVFGHETSNACKRMCSLGVFLSFDPMVFSFSYCSNVICARRQCDDELQNFQQRDDLWLHNYVVTIAYSKGLSLNITLCFSVIISSPHFFHLPSLLGHSYDCFIIYFFRFGFWFIDICSFL